MDETEVKKFLKDFAQMGRARLSDVDKAQTRIIDVIRKLEEEWAIVAARHEDELVD